MADVLKDHARVGGHAIAAGACGDAGHTAGPIGVEIAANRDAGRRSPMILAVTVIISDRVDERSAASLVRIEGHTSVRVGGRSDKVSSAENVVSQHLVVWIGDINWKQPVRKIKTGGR